MPMPIVIASLFPLVISFALAIWTWRAQGRYFDGLTAQRGPEERERPWVRMGFGLDEFSVGTWDFAPALRALRVPSSDPSLESARRAAGFATVLLFIQLPAGLLEANLASSAMGVPSLVPLFVAFISWVVLQTLALKPALWFSRPELKEWDAASAQGWVVLSGIVGGTLLLALVVVLAAQAIRG